MSSLTLVTSTILIVLSMQHISATQKMHISLAKEQSDLETTQPKKPLTSTPLDSQIQEVNIVASNSVNMIALKPAPISRTAANNLVRKTQPYLDHHIAYIQALESIASSDRAILLSLVDHAYAKMAVNFFLTSIKPLKIHNYMILTMSSETCNFLATHGIVNCFQYRNFSSDSASKYGSKEFKDKMNVRTDMILEALEANFTVLHSDTDMIFFRNPFSTIECPISVCDMAVLMDTSIFNAGFLLIHPTSNSKRIYSQMQQLVMINQTQWDDQAQLNKVIKQDIYEHKPIHIKHLLKYQYLCGLYYYKQRYFRDTMRPCRGCIVVHNNWIVGMAAKVYRAKELHHWMYDEDQYYTSTTRKYLTYNNTQPHSVQLKTLKGALTVAKILDRILILPKFNCLRNPKLNQSEECPLNSVANVEKFDKAFSYREHSFLSHPLVPKLIKSSVAHVIFNSRTHKTSDDIKTNFGNFDQSVLVFDSLHWAGDIPSKHACIVPVPASSGFVPYIPYTVCPYRPSTVPLPSY